MSDAELRELARDSSPAGRLKHARALERLGRRDEALVVLVGGREDAAVRRALGEYPAWTHEHGAEGATRSVDVAPLRTQPRVRWKRRGSLDPHRTERLALNFLAGPFVVVASVAGDRTAILDVDTGAELWSV